MQNAARAVHGMQLVETLQTQRTPTHRRVRIAFELHHDAVFDIRPSGAHLNASVTRRFDDLRFNGLVGIGGVGLHKRIRHRNADCGSGAGKSGGLHERTTRPSCFLHHSSFDSNRYPYSSFKTARHPLPSSDNDQPSRHTRIPARSSLSTNTLGCNGRPDARSGANAPQPRSIAPTSA